MTSELNTKTTKITMATLKAFIRRNSDRLYIRCEEDFDAMSDCVRHIERQAFRRVAFNAPHPMGGSLHSNTLGVPGLWTVGRSHDYFRPFDDGEYEGILVYNCCGSATVAIKKEAS